VSGYGQPVIRIDFSELSSGPEDPVWVIIRNPQLMTTDELTGGVDGAYDENGQVLDRGKATQAARIVMARIIVAARVYDATVIPSFDPLTGEQVSDNAQLLPATPWTPEIVAKLPAAIIRKLAEAQTEALVPKQDPGNGTPRTSSGPLSLSTTELGDPDPVPAPQS
jgi:hypothetical protein